MQKNNAKNVIKDQYKKYAHNIFFQRLLPTQRVAIYFLSAQFLSIRYVSTLFFLVLSFFLASMTVHLTNSDALAEEKIVTTPKTSIQAPNIDNNTPRLNSQQEMKNEKESTQSVQAKESTQATKAIVPANESQATAYTDPNKFGWRKYFQAVGTMLFLLLVLWYVLKIVRRYGNGRFFPAQKLLPKDAMYIEGQLSLGLHKCVTIVKVLDKRLVLGITEKNITLLTEMVDNEELKLPKSFHEHINDATTNDSTSASTVGSSHPSTI